MASSGSSFIGSKISLISKAGIRYEGILYTIDPLESTVALSKVRSYGTENRPAERPVAPRDEVYEYIIFRGSDIQDLHVCEPGKFEAPSQPSVQSQDAAIVRAEASAPPLPSFPPPGLSPGGLPPKTADDHWRNTSQPALPMSVNKPAQPQGQPQPPRAPFSPPLSFAQMAAAPVPGPAPVAPTAHNQSGPTTTQHQRTGPNDQAMHRSTNSAAGQSQSHFYPGGSGGSYRDRDRDREDQQQQYSDQQQQYRGGNRPRGSGGGVGYRGSGGNTGQSNRDYDDQQQRGGGGGYYRSQQQYDNTEESYAGYREPNRYTGQFELEYRRGGGGGYGGGGYRGAGRGGGGGGGGGSTSLIASTDDERGHPRRGRSPASGGGGGGGSSGVGSGGGGPFNGGMRRGTAGVSPNVPGSAGLGRRGTGQWMSACVVFQLSLCC